MSIIYLIFKSLIFSYKATLKQLSLFEDQRLRKKALEAMNANMKVACERAQAFIDKGSPFIGRRFIFPFF